MGQPTDTNQTFSRTRAAFEAGRVLPACAWCKRVRIDGVWLLPPAAVLTAIDERQEFSHSICEDCLRTYARE
jgi:hypothetical protein